MAVSFWSWNSMESQFVRQEWEYALSLGRPHFVRPVYWHEPLPERRDEGLPPDELERQLFRRLPVEVDAPPASLMVAGPAEAEPIAADTVKAPELAGFEDDMVFTLHEAVPDDSDAAEGSDDILQSGGSVAAAERATSDEPAEMPAAKADEAADMAGPEGRDPEDDLGEEVVAERAQATRRRLLADQEARAMQPRFSTESEPRASRGLASAAAPVPRRKPPIWMIVLLLACAIGCVVGGYLLTTLTPWLWLVAVPLFIVAVMIAFTAFNARRTP